MTMQSTEFTELATVTGMVNLHMPALVLSVAVCAINSGEHIVHRP